MKLNMNANFVANIGLVIHQTQGEKCIFQHHLVISSQHLYMLKYRYQWQELYNFLNSFILSLYLNIDIRISTIQ